MKFPIVLFKEEAYLEDHKSEIEKSYYPSILVAVGRRGAISC